MKISIIRKEILYISIICFIKIVTGNSTNEVLPDCQIRCADYYTYNDLTNKCEHKSFFPLYPLEVLQVVLFSIVSVVATSVGIGGGGVYSSVLMFVEGFTPSEAFPISTFLIAICSFCTFYMGVKDKRENPKNSFIDYDLAIIFSPTLLLGTKFGTILNKSLSTIFLNSVLILFIFYNIYKCYHSANRLRQKEIEAEAEKEKENVIKNTSADDLKCSLLKDNLNNQGLNNLKIGRLEEFQNEIHENSAVMSKVITDEENEPIRWNRIKLLFVFLLVSIVDQIIEGNSKVPSLLNISRCSFLYWVVFIIYIVVSIYLVDYSFKIVKSNYDYKLTISNEFKNNFLDELTKDYNRIIVLTFTGGVIAGMLGIGGGMITTPLLLRLGKDPKSATSTSNLLIIFTAISGTILFIFSGQLLIGFCLCLAAPCGIAALFGSGWINSYINRTKRSSILIYFLFYMLIFSVTILIITSYHKVQTAINTNLPIGIFQPFSYCKN